MLLLGHGVLLVLLPFVESSFGWSVWLALPPGLAAGMIGLPAALLSAVSADVSGRFVFQIGRRLVVWGIVTCLIGLVATIAVAVMLSQGVGSEWWMLLTLAFIGTSMGPAIMTTLAFSITAVSNWQMGMVGAFAAITVIVILAGIVGLAEVRRGGRRRR